MSDERNGAPAPAPKEREMESALMRLADALGEQIREGPDLIDQAVDWISAAQSHNDSQRDALGAELPGEKPSTLASAVSRAAKLLRVHRTECQAVLTKLSSVLPAAPVNMDFLVGGAVDRIQSADAALSALRDAQGLLRVAEVTDLRTGVGAMLDRLRLLDDAQQALEAMLAATRRDRAHLESGLREARDRADELAADREALEEALRRRVRLGWRTDDGRLSIERAVFRPAAEEANGGPAGEPS